MDERTWWYLSRASGMVAWFVLATSMILGILLATKLLGSQKRPAWLLDLHRWIGGLALTFTAIHLGALVADSYVSFNVVDLLVPMASSWKPLPVAFGVISLWVLLAVQVSSLMMKRLPRPWWRRVHRTSYLLFWTATIHGATAGTDATATLYRGSVVVIVALLVLGTTYRLLTRRGSRTTTAVSVGRRAA